MKSIKLHPHQGVSAYGTYTTYHNLPWNAVWNFQYLLFIFLQDFMKEKKKKSLETPVPEPGDCPSACYEKADL